MLPDTLLDRTLHRFPRFLREGIRIEPLEKGGSGRKYYRIAMHGEGSLILVKYGSQREENRHYCEIAAFLSGLGIRVPAIWHHDAAEGLIWMEDLGEIDLWHHRLAPWPERRPLYQAALEQLVRLHTRGHAALAASPAPAPVLQPEFDAALYRWEQGYFFENCAGRHFGVPAERLDAYRQSASGRRQDGIADALAALPRVLVHRDFQSQNILIREGEPAPACLIDFQGMRRGLPQYDLASLLYDPYVSLPAQEREALLNDYIMLCAEAGEAVPANFREIFDQCAMQRLMQALGAYGFLGLVQERHSFLEHIPPALASLREVAERIPGLEGFQEFLAGLA